MKINLLQFLTIKGGGKQLGHLIFKDLAISYLFRNGNSFSPRGRLHDLKKKPRILLFFRFPRQFLELPLDGGRRSRWCYVRGAAHLSAAKAASGELASHLLQASDG